MLLAALGLGLAGGSFAVGVAYVSKWYPQEKQGTALGIFGAGNVGAAVTKFCRPFVMVALAGRPSRRSGRPRCRRWRRVLPDLAKDDPDLAERRRTGAAKEPLAAMMEPLKNVQVWRFSLYYFFVFGAFVALALWLPRYLIGVYGVDIKTAGMIGAAYLDPGQRSSAPMAGICPTSYGARGHVLDLRRLGALHLHAVLSADRLCRARASTGRSPSDREMGLVALHRAVFVLGFFMSLGKAAVYKHIPVYYPNHVGAVGGLVGMIGGLGGFVLPIAFGALLDLTGIWTSCFMLLFVIVAVSLAWMHFAIRADGAEAAGAACDSRSCRNCPEMQPIHDPNAGRRAGAKRVIDRLAARGPARSGKGRAARSPPQSVDLDPRAAAVLRGLDGVVGGRRQAAAVGFNFTTDQLFWLAALPGLSGATLRIFYSFMVPIFGGRLWTTLTTWSLMIPALGIGYAVQNPETPYWIFLVLALLCGFGGGNFASSMANISLLLPEGGEGQCAGAQRRPRQSRRQRHAVRGAAGHHRRRVRRARRRAADRDQGRRGGRSGCRMPASSGCRSSLPRPSRPGSA
jgi:NNP family nitrate/nitrite transporter-like MFS transporter